MKHLLIALSLLLSTACTMERQEVIAAVKECEDAGMVPIFKKNTQEFTVSVRCMAVKGPNRGNVYPRYSIGD